MVGGVAYGGLSQSTAMPPPGEARLRIVSWNLRNFPTRPDLSLRSGTHAGDPAHDLPLLATTFSALAADVIVLQEVHDADALHGVVSDQYTWAVSEGGGARGQHLVVAWRHLALRPLGSLVEDQAIALDGSLRPAVAQRLVATASPQNGAKPLLVIGVHLKARPSGSEIRREQWDHLAAFITRVRTPEDLVVLVGDFNVTGATSAGRDSNLAVAERRALSDRLDRVGLAAVEVGPCTAYWQGVRHDAWLEPSRLDLAFAAGFGGAAPIASVGTHCRTHACAPFVSTAAYPDLSVEGLSDHCPVLMDVSMFE